MVSREPAGHKKDTQDYFLAGKALPWWAIGASLIAANISAEQIIGMSGSGFAVGLAIASYEWMAAVTLIFVAFWFLPKFLKAGLYTIPEFLEYRFDGVARLAMAIPAIVTLVFVTTSSVIFSGAKFVSEYYNTVPVLNSLTAMCWLIALFAVQNCEEEESRWSAEHVMRNGQLTSIKLHNEGRLNSIRTRSVDAQVSTLFALSLSTRVV